MIYGLEGTIRGLDRTEPRYPVNRRAQTSLAFTQGLLGKLALRYIDGRIHSLQQRALGRKQVMAGSFKIFDYSIRKEDSELGCEIRFLAHFFLNCFPHSVSIVWVDALPHIFTAWKALQRIKPPDSVAL